MQAHAPFIAITGNIGAGKTGLVISLAQHLDAQALTEDIGANPYFDRYYGDPARWAFHSQVAFIADSLRRHASAQHGDTVVQDRTLYETVDVFGRLLLEEGHLSEDQFEVLATFRQCARELPRQPTLLVHLQAPVPQLLERIGLRDREAERGISSAFLTHLATLYQEFAERWDICPVLTVDTDLHDLRETGELDWLLSHIARN